MAFAETLDSAGHFIGSKDADAEVLTNSLKKVPPDLLSLHGKKPKTCKQYWSEGAFISRTSMFSEEKYGENTL